MSATTKPKVEGTTATGVTVEPLKPRPSSTPEQWKLQKTIDNLDHYPAVLNYLTKERGLTRETINAYKVGAGTFRFLDDTTQKWVDHQCVTFPWLQRVPKPVEEEKAAPKRRTSAAKKEEEKALAEEKEKEKETEKGEDASTAEATKKENTNNATNKVDEKEKKKEEEEFVLVRMKYRPVVQKNFRLDPTGGLWGLFGWHLIPPDATEIVLTVWISNVYFANMGLLGRRI